MWMRAFPHCLHLGAYIPLLLNVVVCFPLELAVHVAALSLLLFAGLTFLCFVHTQKCTYTT